MLSSSPEGWRGVPQPFPAFIRPRNDEQGNDCGIERGGTSAGGQPLVPGINALLLVSR